MAKKVTRVRKDGSRISHLEVNGVEMHRDTCIKEIEAGIEYETSPSRGQGAKVIVYELNRNKYLKTERDDTEANNLGGLPTF